MLRDEQASTIVDRIYEAAFAPELWPEALEATSTISSSASGAIFMFSDHSPVRAITEAHVQPLLDEFLAGDTWRFSESVQRMCSTQPASFVHVDDFMTSEEIKRDSVRKSASEFGIGSHVCTSIAMPSGELVLFVFQRWLRDGIYDQGAIDRLDELRPHLARAGLIAGRLDLERARTTVSALEEIGLPAAVMAGSGRVLTANSLLEDMTGVFLSPAHGGMALANRSANAAFPAGDRAEQGSSRRAVHRRSGRRRTARIDRSSVAVAAHRTRDLFWRRYPCRRDNSKRQRNHPIAEHSRACSI